MILAIGEQHCGSASCLLILGYKRHTTVWSAHYSVVGTQTLTLKRHLLPSTHRLSVLLQIELQRKRVQQLIQRE